MIRFHRWLLGAVAVATGALALPAGIVAAQQRPNVARAATAPSRDWTTYHHDSLRTGDGVITGTYTTLRPKIIWHLPTSKPWNAEDQMFASPLVVGHEAIVTTLENRVYAVSTLTGRTLWGDTLGAAYIQPGGTCGDIGPTLGIVSTPMIDPGRGELYVVGVIGTGPGAHVPLHRMFGISISTGRVMMARAVDPPGQQVIFLLQRASLALSKGRVLVGFGGNAGDCGDYHGWVESVPEVGTAPIYHYEVAGGPGQFQGAVWMGGAAPTVDAAGNVYVADGNGSTTSPGPYDYSDAVLKLSPTLRLEDWFAPTTWYSDNAGDLDLGSGAPQLLAHGLLLQVGKTETGYVLNAGHLGHIDPAVHTFPICSGMGQANGGDAIVGGYVVVPCEGGLNAVKVFSTSPYGRVEWTTGATGGPPVFAAGLVWSVNGGDSGSTLYGLVPTTGNVKVQYDFGGVANHFTTPAVGDNMVLVASATVLFAFPPR